MELKEFVEKNIKRIEVRLDKARKNNKEWVEKGDRRHIWFVTLQGELHGYQRVLKEINEEIK